MPARNLDFAWLAASAAVLASCSAFSAARRAVTSMTVATMIRPRGVCTGLSSISIGISEPSARRPVKSRRPPAMELSVKAAPVSAWAWGQPSGTSSSIG